MRTLGRGSNARLRGILAAVVVASGLVIAPGVANANWGINYNDKYYGSAADVSWNPSHTQMTVNQRAYEGSRGCSGGTCGYLLWRRSATTDWVWNGSSWTAGETTGTSQWRDNQFEGTWWSFGSTQTYNTNYSVAITYDYQHQKNVYPFDYDYYYQQLTFQ